MDREMPDVFYAWWISNGGKNLGRGPSPGEIWQAACKWQRERDAEICKQVAKEVYGDAPYECAAAILNQGSKE